MVESDDLERWRTQDQLRTSFPPVSWHRDQRLDILRGWCVAALVVDHIAGWSPLFLITGGGEFYVTAAEGFVCISGYLFGGVYRRLLEGRGMGAVWKRASLRALLLYGLMLGTTALVVAEGMAAKLPFWSVPSGHGSYFRFLAEVATFRYWLHHTRILGMYSLMLLAGPLAILLLRRGWTVLLLLISWAVYLLYQFSPERFSWPFPLEATFHPYAYQLLFMHCLALGYTPVAVRQFFNPQRARWAFVVSLAGLALLVGFFAWQTLGHPPGSVLVWLDRLFQRDYLRPGRLVATVFAAVVGVFGITWFIEPVERYAAPILATLGRRSLFCYSAHLPVIVVFDKLSPHWQGHHVLSLALNVIAQLSVLGGIWMLAVARGRYWPVPRRPARSG